MKEQNYGYLGTEKQINFCKDMMYGWMKGWPSYIQDYNEDYKAIWIIAAKCANIAKVSMQEEDGYMRIKAGICNIGVYCSTSINWNRHNLHYIVEGLERCLIEMNAWRKAKASDKEKIEQAEKIQNEQKEKSFIDKAMQEKQRIKSLIWSIENWDYIWEHSERTAKKTANKVCMDRKASLKDLEKKDEKFIEDLKDDVSIMIQNWREILKKEKI